MSSGEGDRAQREAELAAAWDAWERQLVQHIAERDRRLAAEAALLLAQAELAEAQARVAELESAERWTRGAA